MPSKPNRVTESEVGIAVLKILAAQPNHVATVALLRDQVPHQIVLTHDDRELSLTRENEEVWEQQVRNLRCHKGAQGNLFTEGYVVGVSRGVWKITEAGLAFLRKGQC